MKDTLIGLTTITLLFGIVWLTQSRTNNNKDIASELIKPKVQKTHNTDNRIVTYVDMENNIKKENESECDYCSEKFKTNDALAFSEAFKLCRECVGNEGTFIWNGKLFSTKIKEKKIERNLVEKEDIDSITPPPKENKETIASN